MAVTIRVNALVGNVEVPIAVVVVSVANLNSILLTGTGGGRVCMVVSDDINYFHHPIHATVSKPEKCRG